MKILIIEDDNILRLQLKEVLEEDGHLVKGFEMGLRGLEWIIRENPDLIILDLGLPDVKGSNICDNICNKIPVIIISGNVDFEAKLVCYKKGAIDYIEKPYKIIELKYKINNLERFIMNYSGNNIKYKELFIDLNEHSAKEKGEEIILTVKELILVAYLIDNKGKILSREKILKNVWPEKYLQINDRVVDKTLYRLKDKLEAIRNNLESIRGIGYRLKKS